MTAPSPIRPQRGQNDRPQPDPHIVSDAQRVVAVGGNRVRAGQTARAVVEEGMQRDSLQRHGCAGTPRFARQTSNTRPTRAPGGRPPGHRGGPVAVEARLNLVIAPEQLPESLGMHVPALQPKHQPEDPPPQDRPPVGPGQAAGAVRVAPRGGQALQRRVQMGVGRHQRLTPAGTLGPPRRICASVISGNIGSDKISSMNDSTTGKAPRPSPRPAWAGCKCTGTG